MQSLVSKIPIMVLEGNHEIEEQAENQTFAAYRSRFAFPSKESGSSSPLYYSFNAGGIHFIMLGGYVAYNKSGKLQTQPFLQFCYYCPFVTLVINFNKLSQIIDQLESIVFSLLCRSAKFRKVS